MISALAYATLGKKQAAPDRAPRKPDTSNWAIKLLHKPPLPDTKHLLNFTIERMHDVDSSVSRHTLSGSNACTGKPRWQYQYNESYKRDPASSYLLTLSLLILYPKEFRDKIFQLATELRLSFAITDTFPQSN